MAVHDRFAQRGTIMRYILALAPLALLGTAPTSAPLAQDAPIEAGVDYAGFVQLAGELGSYRETRLLGWQDWHRQANLPGAIILDTRSAEAFAAGHIAGAVNLPFSDFTDAKLAEVIPGPDTPVFIYCNNNFADDRPPVPLKRIQLALNIPTFINLYGYGYRNVWELDGVMMTASVPWVSSEG